MSAVWIPETFRDRPYAAGFVFRHFSPPPADAPVADVPGAPGNAQAVRWRILAQKPA
jgi:hypothetical protein